jgi:hypothetical protein
LEPDDYFNKLLKEVSKYYTSNTSSSLSTLGSNYMIANDLATDKDLFTSQSIVDLFDDISVDLNNNTNTKSNNTVNNRSAKKETIKFDVSKCIGEGARLVKEFAYTDMQVQITHNRHYEKIQTLLNEFYKLTITTGPDKDLYETYFEHLVYFNATFKTNSRATLTKQGMQYCNDIYNWYEGIKGYIDKFGA